MKYGISLLVSALLSLGAYAQDIVPFTFGPMVGINSLSLHTSSSADEVDPRYSYAIGAFARLTIAKWYMQPEVYYTQKNCILKSSYNGEPTRGEVLLKSTDIDLLLGYHLVKFSDVANIRLFAGPGLSLLHDSEYRLNSSTYADHDINNRSINGSVGLGVDLLRFSVDARYLRGFTDIDKTEGSSLYTNTFLLTAAFKIL